jgi:hypothetical protein
VSYTTDYEIGWIAWGIGALTGQGMSLGLGGKGDKPAGVVAALIALVAVFGGKYAGVHFAVQKSLGEASSEPIEDRWLQVHLADDVVGEREARGESLTWPRGKTIEEAEGPADYPAGIWDEAQGRFEALSEDQREELRQSMAAERDAGLAHAQSFFTSQGFLESLSPHDLLWSALAIATAFKLASRSKEQPEAQAATPAS